MKNQFILCVVLMVGLTGTALAQNRWYVNITGNDTNAGVSWATACSDLQKVIDNTMPGDTVWVAQGTYYPSRAVLAPDDYSDRDKFFTVLREIQIYGGFAGNETALSQRDWANNPTILSGDLGIAGDSSDNAYHVIMFLGDRAVGCLDGFTVTGGNANISSNGIPRNDGGGIYIASSDPVLSNLIIKNNTASRHGGGICFYGSASVLTNVLICNNRCLSEIGAGGGIAASAVPVLTNVTIANNYAYLGGGGIMVFNDFNVPYYQIRNSIIWGNTSTLNVTFTDTATEYSHCLVENKSLGNGIILNSDPLFEDAAAGDFRLSYNSPCRNMGNNAFYHSDSLPNLSDITTDLNGNPRIISGIVDLGAYEHPLNIIPDAGGIVYVNTHVTTGNGRGNSWYNAVKEFADALSVANTDTAIKQIWVAQGTYTPLYRLAAYHTGVLPADDRDRSFLMAKDVRIYGGFPADANDTVHTSIDDRDWEIYPVLLSGDIWNTGNHADNCYHVVVSAGDVGNACLDGFTVTQGNANGVDTVTVYNCAVLQGCGGGVYTVESSPLLKNLRIIDNAAHTGGGIYHRGNSPVVFNTVIEENTALSGGGICLWQAGEAAYTNCLFLRNTSSQAGGAVYLRTNHTALYFAFTNCTFVGNGSASGNCMYYDKFGIGTFISPIFRNCILDSLSTGNLFGGYGGAAIDNIAFTHSITPYHSLGNNPQNTGNILGTDPKFLNRHTDDYRLQPSSPAVNTGNDAYYQTGQTPDISSVTVDLAGRPRFNSLSVDMGVHEHQIIIEDNNGKVYVNKHLKSGNGSGNSWANAAKELADALYAAQSNTNIEQIWVAQATYIPFNTTEDNSLGNGKRNNAFLLVKDVQLYGGFPADANDTEHNVLSSRNWKQYPVVLSGDIGVAGDSSDNCHHVVVSAGDAGNAGLDGFVIAEGNADNHQTIFVNGQIVEHTNGGGFYGYASSPFIRNTVIRNNRSERYGGGIFCNNNSNPSLSNLIIRKNRATEHGGGLAVYSSSPVLTNITLTDNVAFLFGGGMFYNSSSARIRNTVIWGNRSRYNVLDNNVSGDGAYSEIAYSHSLVGGEMLGNGIILHSDPWFIDPENSDYRLNPCSPAINVGSNAFYSPDSLPNLSDITLDLDNNPRFYNHATVDLGAYEYQGVFLPPPFVTLANDTVVCYEEAANVTFFPTGTPNWDIVYTKDNGTSFDTLKNIAASPYVLTENYTQTTSYQLQSVNNHICPEIPLWDRITITVLPRPTLDRTLTDDTLCDGQQTTPVDFTGQAHHFEWTASGNVQGLPSGVQTGNFGTYTVENQTSSLTSSLITVIPVNTQAGARCEGDTHTFAVNVSPPTKIESFTSNETVFCEGEALEMEVSASGGYLLTYQWLRNGDELNGETDAKYTVLKLTYAHNGQYRVTVTGFCGQQTGDAIDIHVKQDSILVEKWDDVIFVDNSSERYAGYQWYKNGEAIQGAVNQFYQEPGGLNGCYKVSMSLKGGGMETSCERCLDKVTKGFSIYPNPTKNTVFVALSKVPTTAIHYQLYDIQGKELQRGSFSSQEKEIDISSFSRGIYLLSLTLENQTKIIKKIVKE